MRTRVFIDLPVGEDGWPPASVESIWVNPLGDNEFEVESIPFFIQGVSCGDVVDLEIDDDRCSLRSIVREGGASTVRVIGFDGISPLEIAEKFAQIGAEWEILESFGLVAFNVPASADVRRFREVLDRGAREGIWDYEEACLSTSWRSNSPD